MRLVKKFLLAATLLMGSVSIAAAEQCPLQNGYAQLPNVSPSHPAVSEAVEYKDDKPYTIDLAKVGPGMFQSLSACRTVNGQIRPGWQSSETFTRALIQLVGGQRITWESFQAVVSSEHFGLKVPGFRQVPPEERQQQASGSRTTRTQRSAQQPSSQSSSTAPSRPKRAPCAYCGGASM